MNMQNRPLRIGWASGDITPSSRCTLCGQFPIRISEGVRDPLTATALAMEAAGGEERAIVMSLDAVWIGDYARAAFDRELARRLPDVPPERVLISATHTHTAPDQVSWFAADQAGLPPDVLTPQQYSDFLAVRLADMAVEAWTRRAPGAVGWGYGQAVVGFNRRTVYRDRSARMYGPTDHPLFTHIEGHENHGVDLLFTFDAARALTGVVVNVACPSQCTEGANFVSADFWHETREELRRRHGASLHILPQCGAGGDQSPHLLLDRRAQERMFRLKGLMPATGGDFNVAQRSEIARRIAAAVDDVLPAVRQDIRDAVELAHARAVIPVPMRGMTPSDQENCHLRLNLARLQVEEHQRKGVGPLDPGMTSARRTVQYYQQALDRQAALVSGRQTTLPVEIHILRVGEVAFCSNRFEFLLDFGERIKARSRAVQTFVVQLAGEGGYLAPARSEEAGSYGAWYASTLVGSAGGDQIVEESVVRINALFAKDA
jgi:hypothetical protein